MLSVSCIITSIDERTCSTDELFKASSYLTEAYLLSPDASTEGTEPTRAPFNYAFNCMGVGFFPWLEGEGVSEDLVNSRGKGDGIGSNMNQFRLERFGKAMSGTEGWEVPGAIISGQTLSTLSFAKIAHAMLLIRI